jgi:hypothetical protein
VADGTGALVTKAQLDGFQAGGHSIWMPGRIKHTEITEHQSIEFRAEATNAFNHAAFVFVWRVLLTGSSC